MGGSLTVMTWGRVSNSHDLGEGGWVPNRRCLVGPKSSICFKLLKIIIGTVCFIAAHKVVNFLYNTLH